MPPPGRIPIVGANLLRSAILTSSQQVHHGFFTRTTFSLGDAVIQERLTTVAGLMPEGIRPQMTPTASIMGQIVIAGIYRQAGPEGGEFAPIPKTESNGGITFSTAWLGIGGRVAGGRFRLDIAAFLFSPH